jgi:hypothetical protein
MLRIGKMERFQLLLWSLLGTAKAVAPRMSWRFSQGIAIALASRLLRYRQSNGNTARRPRRLSSVPHPHSQPFSRPADAPNRRASDCRRPAWSSAQCNRNDSQVGAPAPASRLTLQMPWKWPPKSEGAVFGNPPSPAPIRAERVVYRAGAPQFQRGPIAGGVGLSDRRATETAQYGILGRSPTSHLPAVWPTRISAAENFREFDKFPVIWRRRSSFQ